MKTAVTLLIVLLASLGALAQEGAGLRGVVTVAGRAAAGATITVSGTEVRNNKEVTQTRVTDKDGKYYAGFEDGGLFTVKAWLEQNGRRYEFRSSAPIELKFATETRLDIELVEVPSIRESVTVAAGEAQTTEQISKSVNVIGGQEMRERADFTLIDSLRTIPGFRVQQSGGFGRLATVKTRGLRNSDTAFLLDGIRFRDVAAIAGDASPFIADLTLTSVSKVEVLRGSGSSLYGTNAIGGVVDFKTPEAATGTHGQIAGAIGGLGLRRFRGLLSHGLANGKFGITGGLSRTVYTKGIDGHDGAHNTNFQTRVDADPFTRTHISGRIFFSKADVMLNTGPNTTGILPASNATIIDAKPNINFTPDINDPDRIQRSRFFSVQTTFDHAVNDNFVISASYQGLRTRRSDNNGPMGAGFQPFPGPDTDRFAGTIHTFNGRFTWSQNSVSKLTGGYEFESENFENDHIVPTPADNFSVRARQTSNTFFVQEMVSLADGRLQLAAGFRAQIFRLSRPTFTPATNTTYQNLVLADPPNAYTADGAFSYYFRSTDTKIRAHVGSGYRVPSLYERFGTFYSDFFGYSNTGDPDLAPESSVAFDAGIEQSFVSDRVRLTGTYFYTDITKAIDFAFCVPKCLPFPDPLFRFAGYYNTNGRIARGIETSAELNPTSHTRIFTSYTFTNSDERNPLNLFVVTSPGIPSHIFTLVATQRFGKAWVNFDFTGTSSYLFPFYNFSFMTFEEKYYMYRFTGGRRGDLTGGYTFDLGGDRKTMRVYATVENMFDQKYYENGFRTPRVNVRLGATFGF